jgi:hypothetical protein
LQVRRHRPYIFLSERHPNHLDSEVNSEEVIAASEEAGSRNGDKSDMIPPERHSVNFGQGETSPLVLDE